MNQFSEKFFNYPSQLLALLIIAVFLIGNLYPIFLMKNPVSYYTKTYSESKKSELSGEIEKELFNPSIALPQKLPFSGFVENKGQIDDTSILYYYTTSEMSVGFGTSKIMFISASQNDKTGTSFFLTFSDATPVTPVGKGEKNHPTNYFYGSLHLTNVPSWDEIWYYDLYPQIDLRYYMSTAGLKYEFLVHPGGEPARVTIQVTGGVALRVQEQTVTIQAVDTSSTMLFHDTHLQVFQADKTPVSASFVSKPLISQGYGFELGVYDPTQLLIIDPVWIEFSTFLGGYTYEFTPSWERGPKIAVDDMGNSYITGMTLSYNFPTVNPYNATFMGPVDIFITKFTPTGDCVFSTFLGSPGQDHAWAVAVDAIGNSYITGETYSAGFPTVNATQSTFGGGINDAVIVKLNATGTGLVFSTFLGGSAAEAGYGITVDNLGNAYVTGRTSSTDFQTSNAYDATFGGNWDSFVTKFTSTGDIVFSTFLGGSYYDCGYGIAVDADGNSYITGSTSSSDFPIHNAYQSTIYQYIDAFVTKLNATGTGLVFSTYWGINWEDSGQAIAIDAMGNSYITGKTQSSSWSSAAFVIKLNATGTTLVFDTILWGSSDDIGYEIVVDAVNNCYITGETASSDFLITNAFQDTLGGGIDAFVTKLNTTGDIVFSTFLGGNSEDKGYGIGVDALNNIYISGTTYSSNFPIKNAFQDTIGSEGSDVFVTKFNGTIDEGAPTISDVNASAITPFSVNGTCYTNVSLQANITDDVGIVNATLYYSFNGSVWEALSMTNHPYQVTLGPFPLNLTLYYYFEAIDYANNSATAPVGAPTINASVPLIQLVSPELTAPPDFLNVTEGFFLWYDYNASFCPSTNFTWTLTGNASTWVTLNASTGEIRGYATHTQLGNWNLTVTVIADVGNSTTYTTWLMVEKSVLHFTNTPFNQECLLYDILLLSIRVETNTSLPIADFPVEWWYDGVFLGLNTTDANGYSWWRLQLNTPGTHNVEIKQPAYELQYTVYLPTTGLEFWFNGGDLEPTPIWLNLGDNYTIHGQLIDDERTPVTGVDLVYTLNDILLTSLETDSNGWVNMTELFLTAGTYTVTVLKDGMELTRNDSVAQLLIYVVSSSPVVTVISPTTATTETVMGKVVSFVGWIYYNETPPIATAGARVGLLVNGTEVDSQFSDVNGYLYFDYPFVNSGIYRVAFFYNEQSWGEIWITVTAGYYASWTGPSTMNGTVGQALEFTIYVLSNTSTLYRSMTLILNNGTPVIGAQVDWYINDALQNSTVTGSDGRATFSYIFATLGFYKVVAKHEGVILATFDVNIAEKPKEGLEKFVEENALLLTILGMLLLLFVVIGVVPPARRQVSKSISRVRTLIGRKTVFGPRYCARSLTEELEVKFGRDELHEATLKPAKQEAIKREVSAKLTRFPEFMSKTVDEKVEFTQKTTDLILKRYKKK
ncbi:MAG: SBBP repeat-containing protein [Promethearchaeota archaeon]